MTETSITQFNLGECMDRQIKERSVVLVYLFTLVTFGLYYVYWVVSTKRDINSLGGDIPTTWICLIPFGGLYYSYKYCDGFAHHVKKDGSTIMYFLLTLFLGIIMPAIVQSELNKRALKSSTGPSAAVAAA